MVRWFRWFTSSGGSLVQVQCGPGFTDSGDSLGWIDDVMVIMLVVDVV